MLSPLRGELIELAGAHKWGDVSNLDWGSQAELVAMEDHCKYKWLASIEGLNACTLLLNAPTRRRMSR